MDLKSRDCPKPRNRAMVPRRRCAAPIRLGMRLLCLLRPLCGALVLGGWRLRPGWPTYRKGLAHVCGEDSTIVCCKARQWTSLIPGNRQRLSQGAASVREADDSQLVAVALELGGNNGDAASRFSKSQQGVRVSTFKHDRRLQSCHPARRIESTAKSKSGVHQEQREFGKARNLDRATVTERHRGMANCQQFHRS